MKVNLKYLVMVSATAAALSAGLALTSCTRSEPDNNSAAMANPNTAPAAPAPVAPVQQGSDTAGVTAGTTAPTGDAPQGSKEGSSAVTAPGAAATTTSTTEATPDSKMHRGKK